MADDGEEKTLAWLRRFGYVQSAHPTTADFVAAVRRMQQVYGLTPDGIPGPITQRAMRLFRCSHDDTAIVTPAIPVAPTNAARWYKTTVSFAVHDAVALGGNRDGCLAIIRNGFKYYESLTGLTFVEGTDYVSADIQISASRDTVIGFDGVGNVLALSGVPRGQQDRQLRSIFDADEPWNLNVHGAGVLLQAVWMHELGHLLGLSHSDDPADIMSPYYTPDLLYPQRGDKQRLASLYGIPYLETEDASAHLSVGAYQLDGVLVVRHDGGVAINLKNLRPA